MNIKMHTDNLLWDHIDLKLSIQQQRRLPCLKIFRVWFFVDWSLSITPSFCPATMPSTKHTSWNFDLQENPPFYLFWKLRKNWKFGQSSSCELFSTPQKSVFKLFWDRCRTEKAENDDGQLAMKRFEMEWMYSSIKGRFCFEKSSMISSRVKISKYFDKISRWFS